MSIESCALDKSTFTINTASSSIIKTIIIVVIIIIIFFFVFVIMCKINVVMCDSEPSYAGKTMCLKHIPGICPILKTTSPREARDTLRKA